MPAALASRRALVLPGLRSRMNATQPSAPSAIISALRRYPCAAVLILVLIIETTVL
jgi:hypothetical protein